jgi:hypothetical protein
MKKIKTTAIIISLISFTACTQEKSNFNRLLTQVKHDIKIYTEIPYYEFDDVAFKDTELSDADIKELLKPENKEKYG